MGSNLVEILGDITLSEDIVEIYVFPLITQEFQVGFSIMMANDTCASTRFKQIMLRGIWGKLSASGE